jgi:hypothetical protein
MKLKNKIYLIGVLLMMGNFASIAQNENIKWYSPERFSIKSGASHSWFYDQPIQSRGLLFQIEAQYMILKKDKFRAHFGTGLRDGFIYFLSTTGGKSNVFKDEAFKTKGTFLISTRFDLGIKSMHHLELEYTPLGMVNNRGDYSYNINYSHNLPVNITVNKRTFQPTVFFGVQAYSTKRMEGFFKLWPLAYKFGIQFIIH